MHDDLVKRLRNAANWADKGMVITPSILIEAANVIEELSAKYQKALSDLVKQAKPTEEGRRCLKS